MIEVVLAVAVGDRGTGFCPVASIQRAHSLADTMVRACYVEQVVLHKHTP